MHCINRHYTDTCPQNKSHLSDGLNGGAIFDQQLHHLHPIFLTSNVERRETILVETVRKTLISIHNQYFISIFFECLVHHSSYSVITYQCPSIGIGLLV